MTKLPRITAKIFAQNAAEDEIGQFGSAQTGSKVNTADVAQIQALPAYETGWSAAVISDRNYPTMQDMNGLQKTFSQQIAYCLQNGMPEYDPETTYWTNQFCRVGNKFYYSLADDNTGSDPETGDNWALWNPAEGEYLPLTGGTLTGVLNITTDEDELGTNSSLVINCPNIILDQTPEQNQYRNIKFSDNANNSVALLELAQYSTGNTSIKLGLKSRTQNSSSYLNLIQTPEGTSYVTAPSSAQSGSVVTTSSISKTSNGYVKLGNGIIIQWGYVTFATGATSATTTLPTAFTTTGYKVVAMHNGTGVDERMIFACSTKTTTNFTLLKNGTVSGATSENFLAIGY